MEARAQPPDRRRAAAFARVADAYDRGRPGYPPAAVAWALGERPLDVIDLGAGTGKLTEALLAAGHAVTAVEPLEEMRAVLAVRSPAARLVAGTAEATGLPAQSADAVVAGAAFHWFDREPALAEVGRLLRPGGTLTLFGNTFDRTRPWVAALGEVMGASRVGSRGHWPEPEELRRSFAAVDVARFPHEQVVTPASLADYAVSRSEVAAMDDEGRAPILAAIARIWEREPELAGRVEAVLPWISHVRRCRGHRG